MTTVEEPSSTDGRDAPHGGVGAAVDGERLAAVIWPVAVRDGEELESRLRRSSSPSFFVEKLAVQLGARLGAVDELDGIEEAEIAQLRGISRRSNSDLRATFR